MSRTVSTSDNLADEIFLAVEFAETTVAYDRQVKSQLYATHGILEYWLIDIPAGRVEVYREPTESGYRTIVRPESTEIIGPIGLAELTIGVSDLISAD